ncbi:MAG: hypothetical protein GY817_00725 [bacterium]|nr:hypothetical protein [bacterium]
MLSEQAIKEFKEIYLKKNGIALSDKEALEYAQNLIGLYKEVLFVENKEYGDSKNAKHTKNL